MYIEYSINKKKQWKLINLNKQVVFLGMKVLCFVFFKNLIKEKKCVRPNNWWLIRILEGTYYFRKWRKKRKLVIVFKSIGYLIIGYGESIYITKFQKTLKRKINLFFKTPHVGIFVFYVFVCIPSRIIFFPLYVFPFVVVPFNNGITIAKTFEIKYIM